MSFEKPLLVVLGATGKQGGSVLSYFLSLNPSPYTLRGITRNPTSQKSITLASLGVEMIEGDFDNPSSLDAAFKDADVVFSVTDFWQSYANPSLREKASASDQNLFILSRECETQQNKNIIDAVAQVKTLRRFIFSSLPNTKDLSGGKYSHVYHFDGKAIAEEYGKSTYPELWGKTSVFYAGFYLENYFKPAGSLLAPRLTKEKDTLVLCLENHFATAPFPIYSAVSDTGPLVHALIGSAPTKKVIGVNEWLSFHDCAKILAEVLDKSIKFIDRSPKVDLGDPELEQDHLEMMEFCVEFGFDGGKVDKSIVQPAELEMPVKLGSVKDWFSKQDWEMTLQVYE